MTDITAIAFYLPQFHPVRVNDVNWGEGFTDWINVARASPRFPGHFQPRLPGLLGFYDLRAHEVMIEQAQLARANGVGAFCFHYYRFGRHRLLERPLERLLKEREPSFPFMLCWANEPWTMAWDGRSDEVLLDQVYDDATLEGLVDDLVAAMRDDRYLRAGGKPVFLIYQTDAVPDGPAWAERLRRGVFDALAEEILLGAVYSPRFRADILDWADFVVQFPPHRMPRAYPRALLSPDAVKPFAPELEDHFEAYDEVVRAALDGLGIFEPMMLGVTPDWDNSPRRRTSAHIVVGSTPDAFRQWVADAAVLTRDRWESGQIPAPFLFVNAWNEWAEGAVLEPSWEHGHAYLDAFREGIMLSSDPAARPSVETASRRSTDVADQASPPRRDGVGAMEV